MILSIIKHGFEPLLISIWNNKKNKDFDQNFKVDKKVSKTLILLATIKKTVHIKMNLSITYIYLLKEKNIYFIIRDVKSVI